MGIPELWLSLQSISACFFGVLLGPQIWNAEILVDELLLKKKHVTYMCRFQYKLN